MNFINTLKMLRQVMSDQHGKFTSIQRTLLNTKIENGYITDDERLEKIQLFRGSIRFRTNIDTYEIASSAAVSPDNSKVECEYEITAADNRNVVHETLAVNSLPLFETIKDLKKQGFVVSKDDLKVILNLLYEAL